MQPSIWPTFTSPLCCGILSFLWISSFMAQVNALGSATSHFKQWTIHHHWKPFVAAGIYVYSFEHGLQRFIFLILCVIFEGITLTSCIPKSTILLLPQVKLFIGIHWLLILLHDVSINQIPENSLSLVTIHFLLPFLKQWIALNEQVKRTGHIYLMFK